MGLFGGSKAGMGNMGNIMQLMQMIQGSGNPQAMINMIAQQNPQAKQILTQVQAMTNGKNPQDVEAMVKQLAQQQGMDINQLMNIARQFGLK